MKRIKYFIMILAIVINMLPVSAETKDFNLSIKAADSAYNAGNYQDAISIYEDLMKAKGVSASLLFNLGNCYVKSGDLGKARLCYERAHLIVPGSKEIENNLGYISSKIDDSNLATAGKDKDLLTYDAPSFFESVYKNVALETTSDTWAMLASVFFALMIGAVALYVFSRNVVLRKTGFFSSIAFLIFTISFISLAYIASGARNKNREGIVTAYRINLLKTPGQDGKSVGPTLNQGTKLLIEEEQVDKSGTAKWYKVRLNSHLNGWISSSDYELINNKVYSLD